MFDAIIIGGRGAGSPLAMLLARRGHKVLLVEKGALSESSGAQYFHPAGAAQLKRWGLLEALQKSGCPPVRQTVADVGEFQLKGRHLPFDGVSEGYCPRNAILDTLLAGEAMAAGVEFREGFAVEELLFSQGRVAGIRSSSRDRYPIRDYARIVVGADGMSSIVARSVKAPEYAQVEPLTCHFSALWSGVPVEGREWFPRAGRFVAAAPTHEGLTQISVFAPRGEFREFRSDLEMNFLRALERAPEFAERVAAGKRVEGFSGGADTTNYFRVPHGPGWALVGDAGLHRDAIAAHGLTSAWRDAGLLAEAIDAGLSGRFPLEEALASFQVQRDAAALPLYGLTCEMARLAPPDVRMQALFDALRDDPIAAERYFAAWAGTLPVSGFFARENIDPLIHRSEAPLDLPKSLPRTSEEFRTAPLVV